MQSRKERDSVVFKYINISDMHINISDMNIVIEKIFEILRNTGCIKKNATSEFPKKSLCNS
jgi:hypothetical protein